MTLAVHRLVVLACSVIAAAGCSISHRSGDYACSTQADCATGRICVAGSCVVPLDAGAGSDARLAIDAAGCPAQCTSCNAAQNTCSIDCALDGNACTQPIVCPAGWNCNVACSTQGSCRNGVDCSLGASCAISCTGRQSCQDVTCGSGKCTVTCSGPNSCNAISCGAACACDVTCAAAATCMNLTCKSLACTAMQARGCSSLTAGSCETCP